MHPPRELERKWGRQMRISETLMGPDDHIIAFQREWLNRRKTRKLDKPMHGMVNKLKFIRLGMTTLEAATLPYAIEKSVGEKLAQEEAWTCLGLSGDEMTKQAIAPKLQHPYGCGTEGLIGCDGGLKHVTKSNGTKCQPRADFCVSDGMWQAGR